MMSDRILDSIRIAQDVVLLRILTPFVARPSLTSKMLGRIFHHMFAKPFSLSSMAHSPKYKMRELKSDCLASFNGPVCPDFRGRVQAIKAQEKTAGSIFGNLWSALH